MALKIPSGLWMNTSRVYYRFQRVYWAFKCLCGNLLLRHPGVKGFPTFPKVPLPQHFPSLKLKKKGSHLLEPLKAPSFFMRWIFYGCSITEWNTVTCSSHGGLLPKVHCSCHCVSLALFHAKEKHTGGGSWWLRIYPPVHGTLVQSLVPDPTCRGGTTTEPAL